MKTLNLHYRWFIAQGNLPLDIQRLQDDPFKRERNHPPSRYRRSAFAALMTVAMLAVVTLPTGCAGDRYTNKFVETSDQPSDGSNAAHALMVAQIPLVIAAERIKDLDPKGTGLGGIRLQVDRRALEVWWKGDPPATVREEMALQERNNIKVDLRTAKYSQRELTEATRSIITNAGAYPSLVRVGPLVDGSGLDVGLTDISKADSLKFPFPTKVVLTPMMIPTSRANDSPPWWAGGVTRAVGGTASCSTGFAMARWFLWETSRGILTADHCFPGGGGNRRFNDGAGQLIGTAESPTGHLFTDSLYIVTHSEGVTFDGGPVSSFAKSVHGENRPIPGMFVCTSGAGTGVHCNIMINSVNNAFSGGGIPPPQ